MSADALSWERDGHDWPNRAASRFVTATGMRWHVQIMGSGPALVLLHGTGSSTHSWRRLAPLLARKYTVVAPDLPGHAFTDSPPNGDYSLNGMSEAVGRVLRALQIEVDAIVGHSAGAAIACKMSLTGAVNPRTIVCLNGALRPFGGVAAAVVAPVAKLLASSGWSQRFFVWRARDPRAIRGVLTGTGSHLEQDDIAHYARIVRDPKHVRAALGMMAQWDLKGFVANLAKLAPSLTLVAAANDRAVPANEAYEVQKFLPTARVIELPGLGHLAHEEAPQAIADIIDQSCAAGPSERLTAFRME